jgi:hypothetical protein
MTFYVSRITGQVDVLPDAFAVDDNGDSLRFLTVRDEHEVEVADVSKSTIVGLAMVIADDSEVLVVDRRSAYGGQRGRVVSLRDPSAIEVDLEHDAIRVFSADQLGVWTENRRGHPGYPPREGDAASVYPQ